MPCLTLCVRLLFQAETFSTLDAIAASQGELQSQQLAASSITAAAKQLELIAEQHDAAADSLDLEISSLRVSGWGLRGCEVAVWTAVCV